MYYASLIKSSYLLRKYIHIIMKLYLSMPVNDSKLWGSSIFLYLVKIAILAGSDVEKNPIFRNSPWGLIYRCNPKYETLHKLRSYFTIWQHGRHTITLTFSPTQIFCVKFGNSIIFESTATSNPSLTSELQPDLMHALIGRPLLELQQPWTFDTMPAEISAKVAS
jgi:hypothetical protein